ncbi:hypothetical protein [Psychrobacillus phage Perkons]|nr:hypothetical protein [Psychrobacillus phage Perkons]
MEINQELRSELTKKVKDFCNNHKQYHCYQLDVVNLDGHNLMTMVDIINSNATTSSKRKIIDSMTNRIHPEKWL